MPRRYTMNGVMDIWRAQWSERKLKARHEEVGDEAWERGYRMRARSDGDKLFPNFWNAVELGQGEHVPATAPPHWIYFLGVDLASAKRPGNVIAVCSLDHLNVRRLVDVEIIKGSSPDVAKAVHEKWYEYDPRVIAVEDNAYQGALIEWVQLLGDDFPWWTCIQPLTTTGYNKRSLETGLPSLDVEFKAGGWHIPESLFHGHPPSCECDSCEWRRQVSQYPNFGRDDAVMATWFARQAMAAFIRVGAGENPHEFQEPSEDGEFAFP